MIKLLFNTATPVKMSSQQVLMVLFKKIRLANVATLKFTYSSTNSETFADVRNYRCYIKKLPLLAPVS